MEEEGQKMEEQSSEEKEEVEIKDSRTFIVRDTKQIVIRNVPIDLWERYRDYSRKYSKGNWTYALRMMLDAAEIIPMFNLVAQKLADHDDRIGKLEGTEEEEKPKKKVPNTFGADTEKISGTGDESK